MSLGGKGRYRGSALFSRVTAVAFSASAIFTTSTFQMPTTAKVGDLAIMIDFANHGSGSVTLVTPTGWTSLRQAAATGCRQNISYKVLDASDMGATFTGMNDTTMRKDLLLFTPNRPIKRVQSSVFSSLGTTNDPTAQNILASAALCPCIVLGAAGTTGTPAFASASPAFDATIASGANGQIVGYKVYNSGPVDHAIDMADLGQNILHSGFVSLS